MFAKRVTIGRPFGIPIRVDASWIAIAVLVTWSLKAGFFPRYYGDLPAASHLGMALVGALGFFLSILFHEFAHALVARRFGVEIRSITLFIFGGVGEMSREPPSPAAEFWIAVAGPASSAVLAALFAAPFLAGAQNTWLIGVSHWLALANAMLAAFNMVPAFPLDGGRVLRSLLWRWRGSLEAATRTVSGFGRVFGLTLVMLGGLQFLVGNIVGAVWLLLIGLFLHQAAAASYGQLMMRRFLEGVPVRALMKKDPVAVPPSLTLDEFVHDCLYRHHHKMFPVVEKGQLIGRITLKHVGTIPREEWSRHTVAECLVPRSKDSCLRPDTDLMQAVTTMNRTGNNRMLVETGGQLEGILTLKDVLAFFALKMELEGSDGSLR